MSTPNSVRIWDLPTRIFHWLLAACLVGSFVTVKVGGFWMDYHFLFGYAVLALLVFRLSWGLLGPRHARFAQFVRGPRTVAAYLRGRIGPSAGHTPLGALSVLAMLAALSVQAVTGLFANDGIMNEGPLAAYVSGALSDTLTGIHLLNETILLALIGLHILAVAWYAIVRRQRLVRAMITGDKHPGEVPPQTQPSRDDASLRMRAALVAAIATALAWWIASLGRAGF